MMDQCTCVRVGIVRTGWTARFVSSIINGGPRFLFVLQIRRTFFCGVPLSDLPSASRSPFPFLSWLLILQIRDGLAWHSISAFLFFYYKAPCIIHKNRSAIYIPIPNDPTIAIRVQESAGTPRVIHVLSFPNAPEIASFAGTSSLFIIIIKERAVQHVVHPRTET